MGTLILNIYRQPLEIVSLFIIFLVALWAAIKMFSDSCFGLRKTWYFVNILVFIISLFGIFFLTICGRDTIGDVSFRSVLIPFYTFSEAKKQPELYRAMMMNVFLFVPLGLSLPYIIPRKWQPKVKFAMSIIWGLILSSFIEWCQYRYGLGFCEIDDVIMNTLGTAIGATSFIIGLPKKKDRE